MDKEMKIVFVEKGKLSEVLETISCCLTVWRTVTPTRGVLVRKNMFRAF